MPGARAYNIVAPVLNPQKFFVPATAIVPPLDLSVIIDADADKASRTSGLPSTNSITCFTFAKLISNTGNFQTFFSLDDGAGEFQVLETEADGVTLNLFDGPANGVAGAAMIVGHWYGIGYSSDGTTIRLYMRDLTAGAGGTVTSTGARFSAAAVTALTVGGSGFNEIPNAAFRGPRIFRTAFTTLAEFDAECTSFSPVHGSAVRDSWFIWQDNTPELMQNDQSGNGRNLTRGAGAWTVSDKPPLAIVGALVLTADPGTVPITGTVAGLRAARMVAASSGSVPITGSVVGLQRALKVVAASGSVPITGTVAGLKAARMVAASSGAVPITGSNAGLVTARKVTAASGAVPITGSVAGLQRALKLGAASGAVPISGTAAGLSIGRKINASAGAVPITGTVASLHAARVLGASSGAVSINGTVAGLQRALKVAASSGSVPINGTDATLTKGGGMGGNKTLAADSGPIPITGSSAVLRIARRVTASSGAVPVTGIAAVLRAARAILASSGAVPIIGTDAALTRTSPNAGVSFPATFGTQPSQIESVSDEAETNTFIERSHV